MSDNNRNNGRHDYTIERWARAFGVSKERLAALIKEVVEERQALGKQTPAQAGHVPGDGVAISSLH